MGMMVDVDAAIEAVQDVVELPVHEFSVLCDKLEALAVDAAPVVHGRWIEKCDSAVCSACGDRCYSLSVMEYRYCPNCGAKMDLEVET